MKSPEPHITVKRPGLIALALLIGLAAVSTAASDNRSSRTLRTMARAYVAFGQYDKAHLLATQALARAQTHADPDELAMCLIDLGTVCQYQDKLDTARQMLAAGIAIQKQAPLTNPYIAHTLRMLSSVYRRLQQYENARTTLDEAITIMLDQHTPEDPALAFFRAEQARLLADLGDIDRAANLCRQALSAVESLYGPEHLCTAGLAQEMAALDLKQGRFDEAQTRIDQTIRIRQRYHGPRHTATIDAILLKAQICRAAGDFAASEQQIAAALAAAAAIRDPVRLSQLHHQAAQIRNNVHIAKL